MSVSEKKLNRYKKIFEKCDTDNDNFVTLRELKVYLKTKGNPEHLPKDQIIYIFESTSSDGSKKLNFDEFVEFMEHPELKFVFKRYLNRYVNFLIPRPKVETPPPEPEPAVVVPKGRSIRVTRSVKTEAEATLLSISDEDDDIAYMDQFTCCPPPITMLLITILELAFFLTDEITEKDSTLRGSGVTAQIFMYEPNKRHEAWRFLTYMFVHIGYFHIVINSIFQLLMGIPLEMVHGWWRVSLLYFLGVIAGSLTTSVTDPWVRLAGASGGVYCLLTAHIATIIMNWKEMTLPFIQLLIFGIVVVCDLGSSIYDRYFRNVNDQIGYAAHLGGAVAGLLVGIYLLKNLSLRNHEKYLWWGALVLYVVLMVTAIFLNIFLPHRYPPRA